MAERREGVAGQETFDQEACLGCDFSLPLVHLKK